VRLLCEQLTKPLLHFGRIPEYVEKFSDGSSLPREERVSGIRTRRRISDNEECKKPHES
jgi:hypothetical protein